MNIVERLLRERGITDSQAFLEDKADQTKLSFVDAADIDVRGSVHLMLRKTISREEVERGFRHLKHV